jgi:hypothetical protein
MNRVRRIALAMLLMTVVAAASAEAPPEMPYVGNVRSHKFHRITCQYAGCPNCTARFRTREEAIEAGFQPGGCCHP